MSNLTKIVLNVGLLCGLPTVLFAQKTNPFPANALTASSYNGKSLGNTNHYTGQPQISFPVSTYESNDMHFNLSLNYNAAGTTIDQIASSIGLGWSITGIGFVKRNVVGAPDEFKYVSGGVTYNAGYLNTSNIGTTLTKEQLDDFYDNKVDGEADHFMFSIPGYSGRVFINKSGQVVGTAPQSNLLISYQRKPNQGRIDKFTITTEAGIVYVFSDEEVLKYKTKIDDVEYTFDYTSTWLLTDVYNSTAPYFPNILSFSYEGYYSNEITGREYFYSYPPSSEIISGLAAACYSSGGACCITGFLHHNKDIKMDGTLKRLTGVFLPDGSQVRLNYKNNNRCDLIYDKALDNIEIVNFNSQISKRITFDYSYASSSGEVGYSSCATLDLTKRLLLKSITEYGNDGLASLPYLFDYELSMNLPNRNDSNYTDYDEWGFYKNSSYPNAPQAYVLKKITYPTGNFSSYEYEFNTIGWTKNTSNFQTIRGIRLKKVTTNEGTAAPSEYTSPIDLVYTYDVPASESAGQIDYLPFGKFANYLSFEHITSYLQ